MFRYFLVNIFIISLKHIIINSNVFIEITLYFIYKMIGEPSQIIRTYAFYSQYHTHTINKYIHWICIPMISWSGFSMLKKISVKYNLPPLHIYVYFCYHFYYYFLDWRTSFVSALFYGLILDNAATYGYKLQYKTLASIKGIG